MGPELTLKKADCAFVQLVPTMFKLRLAFSFQRWNFSGGVRNERPLTARWSSSLIVADHCDGKYVSSFKNVYSAAKLLGDEISCIVCGKDTKEVADAIGRSFPLSKNVYVDSNALGRKLPEFHADVLTQFLRKSPTVTHVLFASSNFSKSVMPRIAAFLSCAPITDVIKIESTDTFIRTTYAGNIHTRIRSSDKLKLMTVSIAAFEQVAESSGHADVQEFQYTPTDETARSEWIRETLTESDLPDLTAASVVVSGGRGLKSQENFDLLYRLARPLNAAVGASRAIVDSGMAPNDLQVGQTGKNVAPQLYLAFGISGAVQHVAGMKDSKTIIAVNKDPQAPIFDVCDYGLVEDATKVVNEMIDRIE